MKQSIFGIETFPEQEFVGFSKGEEWNGWACPYFAFEEGQKILRAHNSAGRTAWFDEKADQFVFEINGEEEYFPAIHENDGKYYPIGNGSWIWEEKNDE